MVVKSNVRSRVKVLEAGFFRLERSITRLWFVIFLSVVCWAGLLVSVLL